VDAGHHLDEGRLAGAVVADERDDLAGVDLDRGAAQGVQRSEMLLDVAHRDQGRRVGLRHDSRLLGDCCRHR